MKIKNQTFCVTPEQCLLYKAAESGGVEDAEKAIAKGAVPLYCNEAGWTALHMASRRGNLSVLRYLLPFCDLNTRENNFQATPLHLAILGGHYECASLLLSNGADLFDKDINRRDAIDYIFLDMGTYEKKEVWPGRKKIIEDLILNWKISDWDFYLAKSSHSLHREAEQVIRPIQEALDLENEIKNKDLSKKKRCI